MAEDLDAELPRSGRLASIDYGTKRIGIAISDPLQVIASPLENYTRERPDAEAAWFTQLVADESIVGFVVGLPLHLSGDESEKSAEARAFAAWLAKLTELPIAFQDERYSSADADTHLVSAKLTKKRRKQRRDMVAAQIILRHFLESR